MKNNKILQEHSTGDLMAELKSRGKFIDNLWTTQDVFGRYDCTEAEAQEVLYDALTNESTMEQIWFAIDLSAYDCELTEREEANNG
jgi:hypothetical protein|tara:strand:+ start:252 stop:509 length:258 start_codon:yes stop_codon:yes gene_type:complete